MKAVQFSCEARGETSKDAFKNAIIKAKINKKKKNEGTIKSKHSFIEIKVPSAYRPRYFAWKLLERNDQRISDKDGPIGCILIEKSNYKEAKQTKLNNKTKTGAKKWKTVYLIVTKKFDNEIIKDIIIDKKETKTKAINKAKNLALKNQCEYKIFIKKELISHDTLEATIRPQKLSSNQGTNKGNLYYFFGWTSC